MSHPRAARRSSARKSGWAMAISASARSRSFFPSRRATPYSVITVSAQKWGIVTISPDSKRGTMRETAPPSAVEYSSVIALPPGEYSAPKCVSGCPPMPLYMRPPNTLSDAVCPRKSTDSALLIPCWRAFFAITVGFRTYSDEYSSKTGLSSMISRSSSLAPLHEVATARPL